MREQILTDSSLSEKKKREKQKQMLQSKLTTSKIVKLATTLPQQTIAPEKITTSSTRSLQMAHPLVQQSLDQNKEHEEDQNHHPLKSPVEWTKKTIEELGKQAEEKLPAYQRLLRSSKESYGEYGELMKNLPKSAIKVKPWSQQQQKFIHKMTTATKAEIGVAARQGLKYAGKAVEKYGQYQEIKDAGKKIAKADNKTRETVRQVFKIAGKEISSKSITAAAAALGIAAAPETFGLSLLLPILVSLVADEVGEVVGDIGEQRGADLYDGATGLINNIRKHS